MTPSPALSCDVCEKGTSRALGFAAWVSIPVADGEEPLSRFRSSARGFCLAHKDQLAPRFIADALEEGKILWQAPEPVLLRPAQIAGFQRDMDLLALEVGTELGLTPANLHRSIHLTEDGTTNIPKECPHCRGRLSWKTGPHVRDAAERRARGDFAEAWECLDCHAAGLLAGGPAR